MPEVVAVALNPTHGFHRQKVEIIKLHKGKGVVGDAHFGATVKHRSRVRQNPDQPNLRQVHLMAEELFEELAVKGFQVTAAEMGENITTRGIDLINLPKDTVLSIGPAVKLQVTGLRNPCNQLNQFQKGLMQALLDNDENGNLIRKAGIMTIVVEGGIVSPGDEIKIDYPSEPHQVLDRV